MIREHAGIVHLVDVIARQHHDILGPVGAHDIQALEDRVGGAAVPGKIIETLLRRDQVDELVHLRLEKPPAALQVPQETVRLVLRQHPDAPHAAVHAIGKHEVDDPELAPEVDGGLAADVGQLLEPAASAAGEYQRHGLLG
jgi:hypothetical protein